MLVVVEVAQVAVVPAISELNKFQTFQTRAWRKDMLPQFWPTTDFKVHLFHYFYETAQGNDKEACMFFHICMKKEQSPMINLQTGTSAVKHWRTNTVILFF